MKEVSLLFNYLLSESRINRIKRLSDNYDIVKAHGGELKVETKEGEGSEFIIQLPLSESRINLIKRLHRFEKWQSN